MTAATHRNLEQRVAEELLRSDLYFGLRVFEIALPPVRQCGDDIDALAQCLLEKICRRLNRMRLRLAPQTLATIRAYPWAGNVCELERAIECAVILCESDEIMPQLLAIDAARSGRSAAVQDSALSLEDYFRRFVLDH